MDNVINFLKKKKDEVVQSLNDDRGLVQRGKFAPIQGKPIRSPVPNYTPQNMGQYNAPQFGSLGYKINNVQRTVLKPLARIADNFKFAAENPATAGRFLNQTIQKAPILPSGIKQGIGNYVANAGQTAFSGMGDIVQGGKRLQQQAGWNKAAGALQIVRGIGKSAIPFTPGSNALFSGANVLSSGPQIGQGDATRRISRGIITGMSGESLAQNVRGRNVKINTPVGEIAFDPYQGAGSMIGFVKNPVNDKFFKLTEAVLPSSGRIGEWLIKTAARGGAENIALNLPDMDVNLSPQQKAQWVLSTFGSGAGQEIVGRGMLAGLGKLNSKTIGDPAVQKQLAGVYDKISDQIRVWKRPVNMYYQELGKSVKAPQILHDLGIAKALNDDRGFAKIDEPIRIGNKDPQQINTGAYTAIDPKTGKIRIQSSQETLRTLMGGTTNPKMSNAQQRARMGTPERLPWETQADVMREKKATNFDRLMQEADESAGFRSVEELQNDIKKTSRAVDAKVNILDYLRTPDRVLTKIGLKNEADALKKSYNKYLDELPKEIDKVTQWYERVGRSQEASQRIFRYLDGQGEKLQGEELKVAKEMQNYLEQWADKLGLPQDKRIASYITHIFEKDFIEKEFDEDLAKIISDKIPGSVYDPFLQQRLGKQGYVEDAFRALDAYVKRATRKYNMDPALEGLRKREGDLDLDSWKYVKSLSDRVNLRPTDLDNLIDNFVKSTPIGYRLGGRPTAALSRTFRQMVYRATLGLNVGSAMRNLSQGANTYAKLGEKYTGIGYTKAIKSLLTRDDELQRVGVLRDNMIQDRTLSATRKFWENMDKGLWALFDMAEKINRGAAYYGAKSRALSQGKTEKQAIQAGLDMARQTQFTFGSVDTPVFLQSDVVKSALQFQSYNVKQAEFLSEMAKNKEFLGMARYIGANLAMVYTIGQLFGMKPTDMIPFFSQIQEALDPNAESRTPPAPAQTILTGITSIPGAFSGDETTRANSMKNIGKAGALIIPGGTQLRKSIQGAVDSAQGYNTSASGRIRFAVNNDPLSTTRNVLFGPYNNQNARDYFDNDRAALGEKQSAYVKSSSDPQASIARIRNIQSQEKQLGIKPGGGTGNTSIDLTRRELKIKNNGGLIKDTEQEEKRNGFFSFFGGKKTEASETPSTSIDEYIQAYELDKYMGKAPTDPLKKITYESNKLSKAKSIYNDDGTKYPDDIKKALIEKMGYNVEDIRYDVAANLSTAERASYIADRMAAVKNEGQLKQFLEDTRTKSLSGKIMGTKSVYDLLIENGYMDEATKNYLLSFEKEIDSKTRKYTKKSKKGSIKLGTTPKYSSPKISIKTSPISVNIPQQAVKIARISGGNQQKSINLKSGRNVINTGRLRVRA